MALNPDPARRPAPARSHHDGGGPRHDPVGPVSPAAPGGEASWVDRLGAPPMLSSLPMADRIAVIALRRALRTGRDPAARLAVMTAVLGGGFAALRFQLLVETLGAAWPDPFMVRRPCCRMATPDEQLLGIMLGTARRDDRAGFDRLLRDMIDDDARSLIWSAARGFVRMDRA